MLAEYNVTMKEMLTESLVITDPEDPKFDLEAYLTSKAAESS